MAELTANDKKKLVEIGIPDEYHKFCMMQQGTPFVQFKGLLAYFHATKEPSDGICILPEFAQHPTADNGFVAVEYAQVTYKGARYVDVGDASKGNVNRMIEPHIIRMASTRSMARALRSALGVGATAWEELEGKDDQPEKKDTQSERKADVLSPALREELASVAKETLLAFESQDAQGDDLRAAMRAMQADLAAAGRPYNLRVDDVPEKALRNAYDSVKRAWEKK